MSNCDLVLQELDFDQGSLNLEFSFGSCYSRKTIDVNVKACVEFLIETYKTSLKTNKNGVFEINLPQRFSNWDKIKITFEIRMTPAPTSSFPIANSNSVKATLSKQFRPATPKIKTNKLKVVKYYPQECQALLDDQQLSIRLMFSHCNKHAIDATGLDHVPPTGDGRLQHQLGPGKASRAMAIIHIAMFEAVIAILGGYQSYLGVDQVGSGVSVEAAIAQAAYDTMVSLYPTQQFIFDQHLEEELASILNGSSKTIGIAVGHATATAILNMRSSDGSSASYPEPTLGTNPGQYDPGTTPGEWHQDPVSLVSVAVGAFWDQVTPFVIPSSSTYRCPTPPAFTSPEFAAAYNEVKALGGKAPTATVRSQDQTETGIFWAYDGTPSLCAPPRLYNQIATTIAIQEGLGTLETCRMLALLHMAMADAGISAWESKYYYKIGRPVTFIREAATHDFGNPAIVGDATYNPLGAPASNTNNIDFTPPFPAYPSGHATFGGALFQVLRNILGTDEITFTFTSDEYNGETQDVNGVIRPLLPRNFMNLSQAEEENGQSRMYLGIHWAFDKTEGITMGNQIADYVCANTYTPL